MQQRKRGLDTLPQRFEAKVNKDCDDCCWIWQAGCSGEYGHLFTHVEDGRNKYDYAHRVAWILNRGPIPEGLQVLHSCDNPPCVNPKHLWLGTVADNMADRDAKGRLFKEFCHRGHLMAETRRKSPKGRYYCLICNRINATIQYHANKNQENN